MIVFWIGVAFLFLFALDAWNHHRQRKKRHKKSNFKFLVFEGIVAVGCLVVWAISNFA